MYGTPAYINPSKAPAFQFTSPGCTNANGAHPCTHKNNQTCISYHKHVDSCPWATGDYSSVTPGYYSKDRTSAAQAPGSGTGILGQSSPKPETWLIVATDAEGYAPEVLRTLNIMSDQRHVITNEVKAILDDANEDEDRDITAYRQVPLKIKVTRNVDVTLEA